MKRLSILLITIGTLGLTFEPAMAQFATQWQLGQPGRGWPQGSTTGGPDVNFVQETGVNPPPGDPNSPAVNQQADDDYYFAGEYPAPIGTVANDEIAMERAFAGIDNTLRIHFNLPNGMSSATEARFAFEAWNLHESGGSDPRYGIEAYFNGEQIMSEMVIRPAQLRTVFTSPTFFLGDVGAQYGAGGDNVIELRGINYNGDNGGNWMGLDYHALEVNVVPEPSSLAMMAIGGVIGLGVILRRRR